MKNSKHIRAHAINQKLRTVMGGAAGDTLSTEKSRSQARRESNRSGKGGKGGNVSGGGNAAAQQGNAAMNNQGNKRVNASEEVAANAMGGGAIATYDPLLGDSKTSPLVRKEIEALRKAKTNAEKARAERRLRASIRMNATSAQRGIMTRDKLTGVGPEDIGDEM